MRWAALAAAALALASGCRSHAFTRGEFTYEPVYKAALIEQNKQYKIPMNPRRYEIMYGTVLSLDGRGGATYVGDRTSVESESDKEIVLKADPALGEVLALEGRARKKDGSYYVTFKKERSGRLAFVYNDGRTVYELVRRGTGGDGILARPPGAEGP